VATTGALRWSRVGCSLAGEIGLGRRRLGDVFRREVGLGVKEAARMLRFERASTMLEQQPSAAVAAVAATCGYYDQAHMANEWRSMAGMSISQWRAVELRDPPIDTVAL
jgi:transcriptional regulator GlxA family with amidase domain